MTVRQLYAKISQLHESPRLIAFAATPIGLVLLWAISTLLLSPSSTVYLISPLLALVLLAPQWRIPILSFGSIFALYRMLTRQEVDPAAFPILLLFVITLLYACYRAAKSYDRLPRMVQRNGQIVLHVVFCGLLLSTWFFTPVQVDSKGSIVGALRYVLPFLLWRCGYTLLAGRRGTAARSGFLDHLFYCVPAYGGTAIPYGKGYDHLMRHRAGDMRAQAQSALAGIKLLILACVWLALRSALAIVVYGEEAYGLRHLFVPYTFDVPRLGEAIARRANVGLPLAWLSLFLELFDVTLGFAIWGHMVIGALRLFGFNVFRNTYKPLLAQSLVEFWRRFYYYFKELLTEFFFLPTYVSTFKAFPRLRIFAAVMSAAFLGNIYYHVLLDLEDLANVGFGGALARVGPRSIYCFLLALGIFISMLREQSRRGPIATVGPSTLATSLRRIAGVWLFYALIHIWNVKPVELTFGQRLTFLCSLFGV
jgi:hypothetical protein